MAMDWKVYREAKLVASCRYAEDAAVVAGVGTDAQIKFAGRVVFTQRGGQMANGGFGNVGDQYDPNDSFDRVAALCRARGRIHQLERLESRGELTHLLNTRPDLATLWAKRDEILSRTRPD